MNSTFPSPPVTSWPSAWPEPVLPNTAHDHREHKGEIHGR
jgi:hypothetical protein